MLDDHDMTVKRLINWDSSYLSVMIWSEHRRKQSISDISLNLSENKKIQKLLDRCLNMQF